MNIKQLLVQYLLWVHSPMQHIGVGAGSKMFHNLESHFFTNASSYDSSHKNLLFTIHVPVSYIMIKLC